MRFFAVFVWGNKKYSFKKRRFALFDVIVIGAGHAGIKAALAAARLGCRTLVLTINLDWVGNMPCNPSIGGSCKGHLVREIAALGGEMPIVADKTAIQCRMLNLGKGPAVQSPRAQIDRRAYADAMKYGLERQENLEIRQAEAIALAQNGANWMVTIRTGTCYKTKSVVLATGTFLRGMVHVGNLHYSAGPDGMPPAATLSDSLEALSIPLRRFKTGTPPRVHKNSIDFSKTERQDGDDAAVCFTFGTSDKPTQQTACHLTYTTPETRRVIMNNLHRSPLFSGEIKGVGPRYCPSIEDKMVRFPDKQRHPVFLEPCGLRTREVYLQGLSSSLPEDVQSAFLRTIPGLENAQITRVAYAIEYDCVDPLILRPTLQFRDLDGLFGAGQFNGSSGYEEAAAQGLIAGINAARFAQRKTPLVLPRASSYIGTMIDDLVHKGCTEPYRMMTSRSEFRLLLRHGTADQRLLPIGHAIGLVSDEKKARLDEKIRQIEQERKRAESTSIAPSADLNALLARQNTAPLQTGCKLAELLRRPQLRYADLQAFDPTRPAYAPEIFEEVENCLKYDGYIKRQQAQMREAERLNDLPIPQDFDYEKVASLRTEARQRLQAARPETIGGAARISGVNPADITALLIASTFSEEKVSKKTFAASRDHF
ncbi:MAG: tRNA uridine-5-carboxymethylaminomethyl(34) synthesis enzyme MnmG [Oscillospiraceae bacterium]|jgi:tRNA uridine 5-carboxymethylaminomethyl modification enzyme|nr:tRNA uridine-5-carboxymethylaminomethyl(34) synthesis enzyme MnmG [Oscillospiraceae bacterium]